MIITYKGKTPKVSPTAFVADTASIIGDVEIGDNCSIWYGAVIRGDEGPIVIGNNSNVQDNCTIHSRHGSPVRIGENVSLGHNCVVHGACIDDNCVIGISAIILDDSVISHHSMIGAGSLVSGGKHFPPGVLIYGSPAEMKSELSQEKQAVIEEIAQSYVEKAVEYK